ncbi:hypothetical protein X777_11943, partial [Ooceraea biroi]
REKALGERLSGGTRPDTTAVSNAPKVQRGTSAYTRARVNGAGRKNYHRPAKTQRDRSLSRPRSQILRARDNYANTLPRWLALRADDDKTQILTPPRPRGGSIDPPSDTETEIPPVHPVRSLTHPSRRGPSTLHPSGAAAAREQSIRFTWIRRVRNLWITPKKLMKAPARPYTSPRAWERGEFCYRRKS